jgi:hypothetical protein
MDLGMPKTLKLKKSDIRLEAWHRGILSWKLRPEQREIYGILRGAKGLKFTMYCSRRWGKSFLCMLMASEDALRAKSWEIGFVAPTQKSLARVYKPIMDEIFKDCPAKLKPQWKIDISGYLFPSTGSVIFMSGTDNKRYEDLRGMNLHKSYFDEPGSMSDLNVIVNSIVQPMTMTTKEERGESVGIILLGTPSATPAHDYYFIKEICKSTGNYVCKTIYDNSSLTKETILEYITEAGGLDSTTCKREYLCMDVVDTERAVLPEFDDEAEKEIVVEHERPQCFDLYGALDPAFNHFTGYIVGYYDFLGGKYVIEGDFLIRKVSTPDIAAGIKALEERLFPNNKMSMRVSDTASQVIYDLKRLHDLNFVPTAKDDKEAQVNFVRTMIKGRKLIIHPRCKDLIRHMKTAIWNATRKKFEETEEEGHFDLVDCLIYFMRNVSRTRNPYPHEWEGLSRDTMYVPPIPKGNHVLVDAILR